ncbi:MAG: RagB/SusD family nutrient uptake outer membrane protein [Bacteroidales bacterium]
MKKIYIFLLFSLLLLSCNKFIDVVPKGKTIPTSVDDLAKLMNCSAHDDKYNRTAVAPTTSAFDLLTDDGYISDIPNTWVSYASAPKWMQNMSKWAPYIYELSEEDPNWNKFYKAIYILNYIIENVDVAAEGRVYNREDIKGRALTHRALNYLILLNIYANHYDIKTAGTDLGVPLILQSDITVSYPRSTVAKVYEQIINDLENALKLLKYDLGEYNHIPGRATANAILARTYLYMGDNDKSYHYVCEALKVKSSLCDLNLVEYEVPGAPWIGLKNYEIREAFNPEILFNHDPGNGWGYISSDLQAIYGGLQDLRLRYFCLKWPEAGCVDYVALNGGPVHSGINIGELWITKAETAIRKRNPEPNVTLKVLNHLRKFRIDKAVYKPYTENNPDKLLRLVLDERRRELPANELRWFDLKRLNKNPKTAKTITHKNNGKTYILEPNSPLYVLPIPKNVMVLNSKLIQNPAPGR